MINGDGVILVCLSRVKEFIFQKYVYFFQNLSFRLHVIKSLNINNICYTLQGMLDLYEATFDNEWLDFAVKLQVCLTILYCYWLCIKSYFTVGTFGNSDTINAIKLFFFKFYIFKINKENIEVNNM